MLRHRRLAGSILGALAVMAYFTRAHLSPAPGVVRAQSQFPPPAGGETAYVDPETCAGCHRRISETYRRTGMARSFYKPSSANAVEDFTKNNTYYHRPSDSWFTMLRRDCQYYQRRYQLDTAGKTINGGRGVQW